MNHSLCKSHHLTLTSFNEIKFIVSVVHVGNMPLNLDRFPLPPLYDVGLGYLCGLIPALFIAVLYFSCAFFARFRVFFFRNNREHLLPFSPLREGVFA